MNFCECGKASIGANVRKKIKEGKVVYECTNCGSPLPNYVPKTIGMERTASSTNHQVSSDTFGESAEPRKSENLKAYY